jgi:hypothetical protein
MYKHDDYMVMDSDTAALSHLSTERMLRYRRELAATYNTIHSQSRLVDLMAIETGVDGTLLSLLCTLLGISTINIPDRTKHYDYYIKVRGKSKNLPSTSLMDRLINHESVWGFPYGSLGYPMYYYPSTYVHPSRMVVTCATHYLKGGPTGTTVMDILEGYERPLEEVLANIQIFGDVMPRAADWYLMGGYNYQPLGDMEAKAYATISSLTSVWLQSGLCPISASDIKYLTFPPQWLRLYEELIYVRKASEWVPNSSTGTTVELLLYPLMSVHALSNPQGLRSAMNYVLGICAPGGWDLLLVVLAALEINKAYVAAHNTIWGRPPSMGAGPDLLCSAKARPIRGVGNITRRLEDGR